MITLRSLVVLAVTPVGTGGNKFPELMADHIFGHIYRDVLLAVVYREGMFYETWEDC